jgi:hypothetical protein
VLNDSVHYLIRSKAVNVNSNISLLGSTGDNRLISRAIRALSENATQSKLAKNIVIQVLKDHGQTHWSGSYSTIINSIEKLTENKIDEEDRKEQSDRQEDERRQVEEKKRKAEKLAEEKKEEEKKENKHSMDVDGESKVKEESVDGSGSSGTSVPSSLILPTGPLAEVRVYLYLLVIIFYLSRDLITEAAELSRELVEELANENRRSLDLLSAKAYFYYSHTHELLEANDNFSTDANNNSISLSGPYAAIRGNLLLFYRTACLQHNEPAQSSLICCILRNYLHYNLYSAADNFRLNANFPESRSSAQAARYCYYIALIQAIQLHYSDSYFNLQQAIRRAPSTGKQALGFRIQCHKVLICVQLLSVRKEDTK